MAAPEPVNLAAALGGLHPKGKQPNSARVHNAWITQTQRQLGSAEIKAAVLDIFHARARDAAALGLPPRTWPTALTPHPHWRVSFGRAAESVGLDIGLEDAVEQVNTWIKLIDGA